MSSYQTGQQQQTKRKGLTRAITATEDRITITGVGGTVEANAAKWRITVITANTFDLQGSTFTNAYTSGGTATRTQG